MQGTNGGAAVAELPLHVTEKILCHISPLESARHATVCTSWAATVSARLARPVPHLFVCTPPDVGSDRRGHLVSVALDGARSATLPSRVLSSDTNGMRCFGATPGGRVGFAAGWWSGDVVLVNPVTGVLQRVAAGDVPYPGLCNSRVLVTGDALLAFDGHKLMLLRNKGEEAWSISAVSRHIDDVSAAVNCNGCFYLLHRDGCLSRVDPASSPPPLPMERVPVASLTHQTAALSVEEEGHLLESAGEVLFVRHLPPAYKEASLSPARFEVYKLDVDEERWTEVKRLPADRALFVSPGSSFAVRASDTTGCRSNCIYFVDNKRDYSTTWGVYSMDDRRLLFEHPVTVPGRSAEVLWFMPRVV